MQAQRRFLAEDAVTHEDERKEDETSAHVTCQKFSYQSDRDYMFNVKLQYE